MIDNYYYDQQIRKWILQFANIFTGLKVQTGKNKNGVREFLPVPVKYATGDRVVAMIAGNFTQNKVLQLPVMSCYMSGLELAPERRHGVGMVDRHVQLAVGGTYPEDARVVHRYMPIPYDMMAELIIYTSNNDQMFQILEQVLMLFDPSLQIQTSDGPNDWTKISKVELIGINNGENSPVGTEKRIIQWTLNFQIPIWISPPMDIRNNIIKEIKMRIGQFENSSLVEILDEPMTQNSVAPIMKTNKNDSTTVYNDQPRYVKTSDQIIKHDNSVSQSLQQTTGDGLSSDSEKIPSPSVIYDPTTSEFQNVIVDADTITTMPTDGSDPVIIPVQKDVTTPSTWDPLTGDTIDPNNPTCNSCQTNGYVETRIQKKL